MMQLVLEIILTGEHLAAEIMGNRRAGWTTASFNCCLFVATVGGVGRSVVAHPDLLRETYYIQKSKARLV